MSRQQLAGGVAIVALAWWLLRGRAPVATVTTSYTIDGIADTPIGRFAEAIAIAEGYYDGDTVPRRANNPGALKLGEPAIGAAGGNRITAFTTAAEGWDRLYRQLRLIVEGRSAHYTLSSTIEQMGLTWSGGDRNWAVNVAAVLNVPTSAQLGTVLT